jgi:hypothetical protein
LNSILADTCKFFNFKLRISVDFIWS